ncbi:nicotinate mononucleotide-dependent phosphoribosyltransferase CobT [Methanoregula formicica]|uniref:UPF0284 protein Metfor_2507 n=1 Tax=Methanoregula formicica (strain DSM 22288 / NBRC 105244 / SMSP) TaxID=593750 RepID=L0HI90_METFS|nr:TIGR00303 family protein [Methanoregula formicica]AGB03501.1 TIGR00303 family protein [Methanoregula formicica SMSP]
MAFISGTIPIRFKKPFFCGILANTLLSTVPGVSGAGPSPEKTLLTPVLDAELIATGKVSSHPFKPDTPTGCPTPSTITRAMISLCRLQPFFVNAGLRHTPTVPCYDLYGKVGDDPRIRDAVPEARALFSRGETLGKILSQACDLLVVAECVPGGTTTALCVLRALGYEASVSSSFVENPVSIKEEICSKALARISSDNITDPLDIVRYTGDPMMPVAAGMIQAYTGTLLLAGGTQMLSVAALAKALGQKPPVVVTTSYVRDDPTANVTDLADRIGCPVYYVDPGFGDLGHPGLARYCIGEVKEGFGAGGAMYLAYLMGHSEEVIREKILSAAHVCS